MLWLLSIWVFSSVFHSLCFSIWTYPSTPGGGASVFYVRGSDHNPRRDLLFPRGSVSVSVCNIWDFTRYLVQSELNTSNIIFTVSLSNQKKKKKINNQNINSHYNVNTWLSWDLVLFVWFYGPPKLWCIVISYCCLFSFFLLRDITNIIFQAFNSDLSSGIYHILFQHDKMIAKVPKIPARYCDKLLSHGYGASGIERYGHGLEATLFMLMWPLVLCFNQNQQTSASFKTVALWEGIKVRAGPLESWPSETQAGLCRSKQKSLSLR